MGPRDGRGRTWLMTIESADHMSQCKNALSLRSGPGAKTTRKPTGFILFLVLLTFTAPTAITAPSDAKALVQSTSDSVIARVKSERDLLRTDRTSLYGLVNELIVPHFDFQRISRWVLGKYWRSADADQRQRFVAQFRKLMVRTYATVLLEYADQEIRYFPVAAEPTATRVIVKTEITQPASNIPLPVNYRMHSADNGWKVYDVTIEGVSLLATYRSTFATEIRTKGLDALISSLVQKNKGIDE